MANKLISFDLKAHMGFLKKPDINDGIYLTYNMLHKPALLGILGAIAGFGGYKENSKWPEYFDKLKHLKIGIEPLDSEKGNYQKTTIGYNNTTGFANDDGNLQITEQVLIEPAFRCYLLLDIENADEHLLYERIVNQQAEFLPYLGKNDFSAWWEKDSVKEYNSIIFNYSRSFSIKTIFRKEFAVTNYIAKILGRSDRERLSNQFLYFERLPIGFNEQLYQYELDDFVFSNAIFEREMNFDNKAHFYEIGQENQVESIIQLF